MNPIRRVAFELLLALCFVSGPTRAEPVSQVPPDQPPPATPASPVQQPATDGAQSPEAKPAPQPLESTAAETQPSAKAAPTQPEPTPAAIQAGAKPAAENAAPPLPPPRLKKPTLGWDVNLEGGYGRYFADPAERFGFARARVGLLYAMDPLFYALGFTYDWSNQVAATFGVQAEAMHIESGLWVQAGGLLDTQVHPGVMGSVGWSLFGAEVQYRKFDPNDWGLVVVGKLRIPVTFIAKAFE